MGAKVIALARVHAHTTCTALHCTALHCSATRARCTECMVHVVVHKELETRRTLALSRSFQFGSTFNLMVFYLRFTFFFFVSSSFWFRIEWENNNYSFFCLFQLEVIRLAVRIEMNTIYIMHYSLQMVLWRVEEYINALWCTGARAHATFCRRHERFI